MESGQKHGMQAKMHKRKCDDELIFRIQNVIIPIHGPPIRGPPILAACVNAYANAYVQDLVSVRTFHCNRFKFRAKRF